jgi:HlyD family secretion protein
MKKDLSSAELAQIITEAKPGHPLKKWLFGISTIALLGAAIWYFFLKPKEDTGPIYNTDEVTRGNLELNVTATGNLAPTNQVTVGSELSGTISAVHVDTNDVIKKGDPLAELDTSKLAQQTERNRAALLAAKARVSQAKATLLENTSSLDRLQELDRISGGKTPARAVMDTAIATAARAQADLESADASVAQAEADLKAIQRDLSKAIIRSPVDGIVLNRSVEVGQTVAASFTAPILFLIAEDLRKMDLVVTVAEADIGRLKDGQLASFTVDAWPTRTYHAAVKRVAFGSAVTNNVVTYNTELGVENDDLSLRPGMTATADISVAKQENVLLVPNAALRFDPEAAEMLGKVEKKKETLVQSLSPRRRWRSAPKPKIESGPTEPRVHILKDGKPFEIKVNPGLTDGRFTEVTSDALSEGMTIIISAQLPSEP